MALRVNIKKKDPRFKGDHPRYHAVVSGPVETMTREMRRYMELHGLAPFKEEDGFSIWSSPPAVGGPPAYLAAMLEWKYRVAPTREARQFIDDAFGEKPPEDGLERFLGGGGIAPGKQALQVQAGRADFVANCDLDNQARCEALEAAGWLPIANPPERLAGKMGTRPYRTRDPLVAASVERYMTRNAQELLGDRMKVAMANIKQSRTEAAPEDFDVAAPEGLSYLDFQKGGIHMISTSGQSGIIADDMGLGKAQPLDAGVLTPFGWRTMGEISVDDEVIGSDGRPTRVTGVYPQGEKEIFRVTFSDGASTECCDEHLWSVNTPVRKRRGADARTLELSTIRDDLEDAAGNRKHYIPMVAPIEFEHRDLPIAPYLLGVLLGDGSIKAHYTRFSSVDDEVVEGARASLPEGLRVVSVGDGCDYAIVSEHAGAPNMVRRSLNALGLAGKGSDDKFVPDEYLVASVEQRIALLQGLMDTDGYIAKSGTVQFSSNSVELTKNLMNIVMSLGGSARLTDRVSASGKTHYIATIALPDDMQPFRVARKAVRHAPRAKYRPSRGISRVEFVGVKSAQCIAVAAEDHLYVTDDYILTHNTIQGIGIINARPDSSNIVVFCQANMKLKWAREIEKWKIDQDLTVGVAEGSTFPDTDIVVINYDIVQKNLDALHGRKWDIALPDEAHNLKNEEAQRTQAVLGDLLDLEGAKMLPLADGGQMVHLTGTPKPNRVSEMWPLLTSSRPDLWGRGPEARQVFLNRYQPPVLIKKEFNKGGKKFERIIPMTGKPVRETELQMRLRGSGSFVRRLKSTMKDSGLPPKWRTPLDMPVRLSKEDKELMREAEADLSELIEKVGDSRVREGRGEVAGSVINAITSIEPDSPQFEEMARVRKNLGMIKAPHCAKFILDEIEAEKDFADENRTKTVVFAHHKEVIQTIFDAAEKREKGSFLVYDGRTKPSERQAVIDRFQEDPNIRGIIISLAGATGITLTAAARMRVVEPDWSPSNMIQIEDRIWRIGQEMNVDIGYMSIAGTLDANIGTALTEKMISDEKAVNRIGFEHEKAPEQAKAGFIDMPEEEEAPEPAPVEATDDTQPALPF